MCPTPPMGEGLGIESEMSPNQSHPPKLAKSLEILENHDFFTKNETFPNRSPVVLAHSGHAYGYGNVSLRPATTSPDSLEGP